ncbi:hypothetical protein D9758_014715 [Tetrapyrgos nigripes]|uniref:Uncharacterized protein n=1 Tax=Tetrapyrgos nigripes TaxID=182062 RepID=A0A8H5CAK8_9AGAR|nr:hypothetical protein D9758_014715 [Tetrapyrgos nigripes]
MTKTKACVLSPVDPSTINESTEKEESASWVRRQITGSLTGRILKSSYESLKATGNSVTCLSPWGDQSPLILPSIRFRDLAIESVLAATGGTASIATPIMPDVSDVLVPSMGGSTILVDTVLNVGFDLATGAVDDLITGKPVDNAIDAIQEMRDRAKKGLGGTTAVKILCITLKYKITTKDAALGFYRSGVHTDSNLFTKMKDYLDIDKGWFSPYLFASNRRPVIPRIIHPDFVFCHGPFLQGDYAVGQRLLRESESHNIINFSDSDVSLLNDDEKSSSNSSKKTQTDKTKTKASAKISKISEKLKRSKDKDKDADSDGADGGGGHDDDDTNAKANAGAEAEADADAEQSRSRRLESGCKSPRRVKSKPYYLRQESIINYVLFNRCPAIVVPVRPGSPLVAWSAVTLERLWKVEVKEDSDSSGGGRGGGDEGGSNSSEFDQILGILYEFIELCVDWERFGIGFGKKRKDTKNIGSSEDALREALRVLLYATIRTKDCEEVKKNVDKQRGGIAMWRIP